MAITYIGGHATDNFTPAFNQVNYYFDSTNKNQPGFNYVMQLYESGTANKVNEQRIAPRPVDGYGWMPLQGILSRLVSYEDDLTLNGSNATKSWYKFDLKVGEEYIVDWNYNTYSQYTGGGTFNLYTQLTQSPNVTPHTFVVGDYVNVAQTDLGVLKPMLEGLHMVVAVPNSYTIVIDIPFSQVGTGAAMGGKIRYSDNRKTTFPALNTQTATVYNGALSNKDFLTVPNSTFKITLASTTNRLLTNMPSSGMRITRTQDLFMNIGNFYATTAFMVYFQNDSGDILRKATGSSVSSAIRQIGVGANNLGSLTVVSGTAPLIKPETKYYDFWIVSGNVPPVQLTRKYRLTLDDRCKIEDVELLFLDRMGSLASFACSARMTESFEVKKESYTRALGDLKSGKWGYTLTEGGKVVTGASEDTNYVLRSYWLTDEMSVYWKELITSPFVCMKLNGVYMRVEVTDTGGTIERADNKPMIKKQVTVKLANQENVNI